ncbi:hypothetical protein INT48_000658, partial [Thamnidium elegans]
VGSLDNDLPKELKEMLLLLNQKTTVRTVYGTMDAVPADPIDNKEKYWLKYSIFNYVMLFINGPALPPLKSDEDLLEGVYGFIKTSNFKVAAFVINRMYISAQVMTCNKGSVALIGTLERYHMPESPVEIPKLLPPVLKLAYNCAVVIKSTTSHLKAISSSVAIDKCPDEYFPPFFVRGSNKRTHTAAFSD